jgi:hypothetical protein
VTKEQAEAKIKAAAWAAASEIGWREALRMLERVAAEIEAQQWSGPGNR